MPTEQRSHDRVVDDQATLHVPLRASRLRADQVAHAVERAAERLEREGVCRWGALLDQDYDGRTLKLVLEGTEEANDAGTRARFEQILLYELDDAHARLESWGAHDAPNRRP